MSFYWHSKLVVTANFLLLCSKEWHYWHLTLKLTIQIYYRTRKFYIWQYILKYYYCQFYLKHLLYKVSVFYSCWRFCIRKPFYVSILFLLNVSFIPFLYQDTIKDCLSLIFLYIDRCIKFELLKKSKHTTKNTVIWLWFSQYFTFHFMLFKW